MSPVSMTISFLNKIGIQTERGNIPKNSFIPNVAIKNGTIRYNRKSRSSDLLHEAGHLACVPRKYRALCQGDMGKSLRKIWDIADEAGEIIVDSPMYRALIQCSDPEATAWAWAAGKHMELPEEEIIENHQYQETGESLRFALNAKCYFGINGLRAAGMLEHVKSFPTLTKWLQV